MFVLSRKTSAEFFGNVGKFRAVQKQLMRLLRTLISFQYEARLLRVGKLEPHRLPPPPTNRINTHVRSSNIRYEKHHEARKDSSCSS